MLTTTQLIAATVSLGAVAAAASAYYFYRNLDRFYHLNREPLHMYLFKEGDFHASYLNYAQAERYFF